MSQSQIFLTALASPFLLVRLLRWLAIVQQKEYRLDRFILFLKSEEGKDDFSHLIPSTKDFSRTGMKRPVKTARVLVIALLAVLIMAAIIASISRLPLIIFIFELIFIYFFIPIIVAISILPTTLVYDWQVAQKLQAARAKLKAHQPKIIGITGSYGKTSTKLLLEHVLKQKYSVFATEKSFNTRYSLPLSILKNYTNQEIAILEYAAYAQGEIKELTRYFRPDMAIITGLTAQHLGLFGSVEKIVKAKSELILALKDRSQVFAHSADMGVLEICEAGGAEKIIEYSGENTVAPLKKAGLDKQGRLFFTWKKKPVQTNLIGLHYQSTVQAAIAVAEKLKLDTQKIIKGLKSFQPPDYMIQIRQSNHNATIIDDGRTANQAGFQAALEIVAHFRKLQPATKFVLITSGIIDLGRLSGEIHLELAKKAEDLIDQVIYTGTEGQAEFKQIFDIRFENEQSKIELLLEQFDENSVILIEGNIPLWLAKKL